MKIVAAVCYVFMVAVSEGAKEKRILTHSSADVNSIIQDLKSQVWIRLSLKKKNAGTHSGEATVKSICLPN